MSVLLLLTRHAFMRAHSNTISCELPCLWRPRVPTFIQESALFGLRVLLPIAVSFILSLSVSFVLRFCLISFHLLAVQVSNYWLQAKSIQIRYTSSALAASCQKKRTRRSYSIDAKKKREMAGTERDDCTLHLRSLSF